MRTFRHTFSSVLLLVLMSLVLAKACHDARPWLAVAAFLPLWPLAAFALLWDLAWWGDALAWRWGFAAMGLLIGVGGLGELYMPAPEMEAEPGPATLRLLQWNTQWGGSTQASLAAHLDAIADRDPDIVCLSEAPATPWLEPAWNARRPGFSLASVEDPTFASYAYRLTVLSRHPIALEREWDLPGGHAALFVLSLPKRKLRILMVDFVSAASAPRLPPLQAVVGIVRGQARTDAPVDAVVGDFNTPAGFFGFDALVHAGDGYRRAALWSGEPRATWPSYLPLLDIDHVWLRRGSAIVDSDLFTSRASDHRGQTVSFDP